MQIGTTERNKPLFITYYRTYTDKNVCNSKKHTWRIYRSKADDMLNIYKYDHSQSFKFILDKVNGHFDEVAKVSKWPIKETFDGYRTTLPDHGLSIWDAIIDTDYKKDSKKTTENSSQRLKTISFARS